MIVEIEPLGADTVEMASMEVPLRDIQQEIVPTGPVGPTLAPGSPAFLTLTPESGFDVNANGGAFIPWDSVIATDANYTYDLSTTPTEVTVEEKGWYRLHANVAYDSVTSSRINFKTRF